MIGGCHLLDEFADIDVAWAQPAGGLTYEKPLGRLVSYTENGVEERSLGWGEGLALRVYRWSSGFLVWFPPAGDPQGAIWNTVESGPVTLNATEGWVAKALWLCVQNGAPVYRWNLRAIVEECLQKIQIPGPAYWDVENLAAGLLAGKEGSALLKKVAVRDLSIGYIEGEWLELHEGLPPLTDGTWPLGTWGYSGPFGRLWVHIPADGPALIARD